MEAGLCTLKNLRHSKSLQETAKTEAASSDRSHLKAFIKLLIKMTTQRKVIAFRVKVSDEEEQTENLC
jgi:hypothetical protein